MKPRLLRRRRLTGVDGRLVTQGMRHRLHDRGHEAHLAAVGSVADEEAALAASEETGNARKTPAGEGLPGSHLPSAVRRAASPPSTLLPSGAGSSSMTPPPGPLEDARYLVRLDFTHRIIFVHRVARSWNVKVAVSSAPSTFQTTTPPSSSSKPTFLPPHVALRRGGLTVARSSPARKHEDN